MVRWTNLLLKQIDLLAKSLISFPFKSEKNIVFGHTYTLYSINLCFFLYLVAGALRASWNVLNIFFLLASIRFPV